MKKITICILISFSFNVLAMNGVAPSGGSGMSSGSTFSGAAGTGNLNSTQGTGSDSGSAGGTGTLDAAPSSGARLNETSPSSQNLDKNRIRQNGSRRNGTLLNEPRDATGSGTTTSPTDVNP